MTRQTCIKCRTIPTDILVLECEHSLCIKCASFCCSIENSTIICPFCKSSTYLEEDIVNQICQYSVGLQGEEVRRAGYYEHKKPLHPKQVWYKMSNKENHLIGNNQQQNVGKADSRCISRKNSMDRPSQLKKVKKQVKNEVKYSEEQEQSNIKHSSIYCKYHNEYEVMYQCLQCQSSIICPECVIHGEHKNHQVETIKKAICKIHAQLSSKIYSLDCSIQGLVGASEEKKRKLKSKIDQINKLKMQAASKYKMIRQEIAREEAEVMSKCTKLITCFEEDFQQIQKWIKSDLITIQKQRDSINYILNPYGPKNSKKQGKTDQKLTEIKIVEEYINHFKKNDKYKGNKYLWLNNKENFEQSLPESEQSLTVLTDRIQQIRFVPTVSSTKVDYNQIATKNHSLAASRNINTLQQSKSGVHKEKKQSYARYMQSPFNSLKMSTEKENSGFDTESILLKASYMKDSSKMKRKSLKSQEQTNFLIF